MAQIWGWVSFLGYEKWASLTVILATIPHLFNSGNSMFLKSTKRETAKKKHCASNDLFSATNNGQVRTNKKWRICAVSFMTWISLSSEIKMIFFALCWFFVIFIFTLLFAVAFFSSLAFFRGIQNLLVAQFIRICEQINQKILFKIQSILLMVIFHGNSQQSSTRYVHTHNEWFLIISTWVFMLSLLSCLCSLYNIRFISVTSSSITA